MPDITQPNQNFIPFVAPTNTGVSPQGFDFAQLAQQIAGQVLPALPSLIMSVLSVHPTIGPQLRAQSAAPPGVAPQSLFNFGVNTPFGGGGLNLFGAAPTPSFAPPTFAPQGFAPQGFDFGQFAQQLAGQVLPALPGLVMSLLSAHPLIGPQLQRQAAAPPGVAPQSLFNLGVNTPLGAAGVNLFGAAPQAAVTPQSFDFGQLAQQVAGQVAPILPGIIMSVLSTNPVLASQQQARVHTTH